MCLHTIWNLEYAKSVHWIICVAVNKDVEPADGGDAVSGVDCNGG